MSTLKAKLAQQHAPSPQWSPRPKSVLKLHIGEELVRTVQIASLVDSAGNLSYQRLVSLAVESMASSISSDSKNLPDGWEITTMCANEFGERVIFSGDKQFTSAFKRAERKRPIDISAFYLAAITPKTTRASMGTVFRCWVDINMPTPKPKVPRGGLNGHIPIGMKSKPAAKKSLRTKAWMRPPPSDSTMRNYHQLQLLIESFVCILARALLIVHHQYNPLQLENAPHAFKTRRTVGRGSEIRLSSHAANIKSVTDMRHDDEESEETKPSVQTKPEKSTNQGQSRGPEILLERLMGDLNRKLSSRNVSVDEAKKQVKPDPKFKHWRHGCDGCRKYPIVGFRYHAINVPNYDLCQDCFSKVAGCEILSESEGSDRYQADTVRSVRRAAHVRHFRLPSDSLLQQARMSTQRKKEQGSSGNAMSKRNVYTPVARTAKSDSGSMSTNAPPKEMEKAVTKEVIDNGKNEEKMSKNAEEMSDVVASETKNAEAKQVKDIKEEPKAEPIASTNPEAETCDAEENKEVPRATVKSSSGSAEKKKLESNKIDLDPAVSQVMNTFENAVLAVGGLVHEVVEGGIKVSRDAQPTASFAATETKKHAAIFAASVVGAAKRAAQVAAESKKRAESYAENVKRAAAEAESRRLANEMAATKTVNSVKKEGVSVKKTTVVEVEEAVEKLVTETKEKAKEDVKCETVAEQMEEESTEKSVSPASSEKNEQPVEEEPKATEETEIVSEVSKEEPMVPSIVLDDEDEASSSISFRTPCSESDKSVQSVIVTVTSNNVAETEKAVSDVSSEECSILSAPSSDDEWDVVDSNSKDEDSIARATVLIGSSLFEADVNRTADDAVVVEPSDDDKSVSSASVASSMSLVSQVSSEGSSISFVSTGSVMTFDSSVASITDDFDVVEATLDV